MFNFPICKKNRHPVGWRLNVISKFSVLQPMPRVQLNRRRLLGYPLNKLPLGTTERSGEAV